MSPAISRIPPRRPHYVCSLPFPAGRACHGVVQKVHQARRPLRHRLAIRLGDGDSSPIQWMSRTDELAHENPYHPSNRGFDGPGGAE
jgi:hypothetical protein